jgi:hypothetical protein
MPKRIARKSGVPQKIIRADFERETHLSGIGNDPRVQHRIEQRNGDAIKILINQNT